MPKGALVQFEGGTLQLNKLFMMIVMVSPVEQKASGQGHTSRVRKSCQFSIDIDLSLRHPKWLNFFIGRSRDPFIPSKRN